MSHRLLGIVLCGGKSTRMGADKASLRCSSGITFFELAISRLQPVCSEVAASGKVTTEQELVVIPDPSGGPSGKLFDRQGPAAGIAASLRYASDHGFAACLVTPVDTPNLTTDDLEQLRQSWLGDKRLTLARSDRIEPLIGIYPIELSELVWQLATSNDRSLHRWIKQHDHTALSLPAESCRNINCPEDLHR